MGGHDAIVTDWNKHREGWDYEQKLETKAFLQTVGKEDLPVVKQLHEEVFSEIDCLKCANCCKTTPAIVTKKDAKRIAAHLGMPPKTFIRKYLLEDVNGELNINGVPCTFLNEDNTCDIYEVRPAACRNYPHTDEDEFVRRANYNANNTVVCPAAFAVVERLKKHLQR